MGRAVPSTYPGALPAPRAAPLPPLAGPGGCFILDQRTILSPAPHKTLVIAAANRPMYLAIQSNETAFDSNEAAPEYVDSRGKLWIAPTKAQLKELGIVWARYGHSNYGFYVYESESPVCDARRSFRAIST